MTKDWKYVYWPYGEPGFEPTEELFHVGEDPLELANLAGDVSSSAQLNEMRALYDELVSHWRENSVEYHDYRRFATVFDRTKPWSAKSKAARKPKRRERNP